MPDGKHHVFRRTKTSGTENLGALGGKEAHASVVAADGSVVVGHIVMPDGSTHAFRWTE